MNYLPLINIEGSRMTIAETGVKEVEINELQFLRLKCYNLT